MAGSRYFDRIAVAVTALMLALTLLLMSGALGIQALERTMGYETRLFDNTRVHTIDIVMDDWDDLIANATSEEYYAANVVIDGEAYQNVGIRAKGNTSLSTVASLGSERYSFKIEFDHYDSTKSYYGLDKLSLNNLIQDSTMMKDYLTYTLMGAFGVHSSLCSYVFITVNGEDWGLYLAVEGVEEAFLERNYGRDYGELYKPDSMSFGGGRGNGKDFDMADFDFSGMTPDDGQTTGSAAGTPEGFDPGSMGGTMPEDFDPGSMDGTMPEDFDPGSMGGGFGGMGSSDVKLQYIDDDPDSYSNIWDNAKTDITDADQTRLIESLEMLSNYEDIESVVDVDQVIRYFVVHNYVCNGDSYTGSMVHNYYLYEEDGRLAMIPWDYNLAFGTFTAGDASGAVNTPIDAPVSGGSGEDRPMWYWILSDETYTDLYHQYFEDFLATVDIEGIIDQAYALIAPYVERDPTAFYTYEEFETGVETLRQFCALRTESIAEQLETGETTEDMGYADASDLNLTDMGSMNTGGPSRSTGGPWTRPEAEDTAAGQDGTQNEADAMASGMPENAPVEFPGGFDLSASGGGTEMPEEASSADGAAMEPGMRPTGGGQPVTGGDLAAGAASDQSGWLWLAVSAAVLALGLAVAAKVRG